MSQGPAYQALVFVCQVAVFGGLVAWFLRGTRPGRDVCKGIVWLYQAPARRRAARAHQAWDSWLQQINYWAGVKRQHQPGTSQYEAAQDCINALRHAQPPNPNHPRSTT